MSKRAILAVGLLCAAVSWASQAQAVSYTATYNISDAGGVFGDVVNHFEGINKTNVDTININLTGPGQVDPGIGGAVALNFTAGPKQLAGFSSFTYVWKSDDNSLNISGAFSTTLQNYITLPFTATNPAGLPGLYHLIITSKTNGKSGGGYVYSLEVSPCSDCASTVVPVPPAAALFASALAGLGMLGRRRRKAVQSSNPA